MPNSPPGKANLDLPGVHKTWVENAAGETVARFYAWRGRGAPKIWDWTGASRKAGEEAARAAAADIAIAYASALSPKSATVDTRTVGGVLDAFEVSEEFKAVSASTRKTRLGTLKSMRESKIAKLPTHLLAAKGAVRTIKTWRADEAEKHGPRGADLRVQLLGRALNWAICEGYVTANPAANLKPLYSSDRSEIIWETQDIEAYAAAERGEDESKPLIGLYTRALMGVCFSGLSRQDLLKLTWPQIGEHAITGKRLKAARRAKTAGKKAKTMVVPITADMRWILNLCREHCDYWEAKDGVKRLHVFLNSRGKPWTLEGFSSEFFKIRDRAGGKDADGNPLPIAFIDPADPDAKPRPKTLHDGRGTFVTHMKIRMPDVMNAEIATMLGWEEEDVERIALRYVDGERVAAAWLERLRRAANA